MKKVLLGVSMGILALVIGIFTNYSSQEKKYYFRDKTFKDIEIVPLTSEFCQLRDGSINMSNSLTSTSIVSDNTYICSKLNTKELANQLIQEDSLSQKEGCPVEITSIEETLVQKYGITAVNLCEMDVEFARELEQVFEKIYNEYPAARGYLTNITLKNESMTRSGVIASFSPIFTFADINDSKYQLVVKTQMFLSSSYFLNKERLSVATHDASVSGHFPKNATIYSPIAHEMGHYLSFVALLKSYEVDSILLIDKDSYSTLLEIGVESKSGNFARLILEEAYQKYKQDTNTNLSLDDWRGKISNYALAKDNSGNYIYDETIAEAFHDVYLNNEKANVASTYIVNALKERLQ